MKKIKIVLIGVLIFILLTGVTIIGFGANYLYNLALNPTTPKDLIFSSDDESTKDSVKQNETSGAVTIDDKKEFLLNNNIAVWDVIASCEIEGSSDSSIKNVVANDLNKIIDTCDIKQIFCNGGKSFELYKKYCEKNTNLKAIKLPSTSPANARFSLEKLINEWQIIKNFLYQ